MFIKTTKAKGYEYIKLVESYREGGTVKHRTLYNFGRSDLLKKSGSFVKIVKRLCEIAEVPIKDETSGSLMDRLDGCGEATLYNYGYLAYLKLWKKLGIEDCLDDLQYNSKIEYPLPETVFLMAVQHLLEPRSKLSTYERQGRYFGMGQIRLHHMYRALETLGGWKEDIETEMYEHNYMNAKKKVDIVFYDVTTISFESVIADGLRNFGFSKNCKFNEVQVVMGMIIDADGLPVGYELFGGNTFDGKTMVKSLENIKGRFGVNRVIIVADRGINSKGNLNLIKKAGYGYIVSSKIKGMSQKMQSKMLDPTGFIPVNDKDGKEVFRYKAIEYENKFEDDEGIAYSLPENLIVSYSPKRAVKDLKDRERLIEKAKKLLEDPKKIKSAFKRGGKKYIDKVDPKKEDTWVLATEKIEKDAKFDGYYGIQTSEKDLSVAEALEAYRTLWKIEESFRIMKSTMEIQPVYHWSPHRIKGHFVLCYLAFLMERKMELILKSKADEVLSSPQRIQETLNTMQLAAVTVDGGKEIFIKAKTSPLCNKIFKILKIKMPPNLNTKSELIDHFQLDTERSAAQLSFFDPID